MILREPTFNLIIFPSSIKPTFYNRKPWTRQCWLLEWGVCPVHPECHNRLTLAQSQPEKKKVKNYLRNYTNYHILSLVLEKRTVLKRTYVSVSKPPFPLLIQKRRKPVSGLCKVFLPSSYMPLVKWLGGGGETTHSSAIELRWWLLLTECNILTSCFFFFKLAFVSTYTGKQRSLYLTKDN